MYVFELRLPGTWIADNIAHEPRREAEGLFHLLESALGDAAVSLAMFDEARIASGARLMGTAEIDARPTQAAETVRARYAEELRAHPNPDAAWSVAMATNEALRAEVQRERWRAGEIPWAYRHRLPFIHAKTFTYALDTIGKALRTLQRIEGAPQASEVAADAFYQALPTLVDVRDSAHHPEDRVRGRARNKSITLQPIMTGAIHAPNGGVLVIDQLTDNRYGGTLADGSFGEVEVSLKSATVAQRAIQGNLDAWPWKGSARTVPS